MLARRTTVLTALGLLGAQLAAAQSAPSAPAPTGTDMLFWLLGGILCILLIVVLVTGASVASAVARRSLRPTDSATDQSGAHTEEGVAQC